MNCTPLRCIAAVVFLTLCSILALPASGQQTQPDGRIDMQHARALLQKERKGEPHTADEQAYLERARAARRGGNAQPAPSTGLIPLDQMTATDTYKGQDGGLYGHGQNDPPADHAKAATAQIARIQPLDENGVPAPEGKVVLISMGMSNTTQEFSAFKQLADADRVKSAHVVIVDCAIGGKDGRTWAADAEGKEVEPDVWHVAEQRLRQAGVTRQQVQAIWVKHAIAAPGSIDYQNPFKRTGAGQRGGPPAASETPPAGQLPRHAQFLRDCIASSLQLASQKYPNLRVAYLSSRIYAGYATSQLNPEPYAYESAFAVRKVILDQIAGKPDLNYDPSKGPVKSPLLLWGPYLWADGVTPRKSDGLIWRPEDLGADGTHPSESSGRRKVGEILLKFFTTNPYASEWFTAKTP